MSLSLHRMRTFKIGKSKDSADKIDRIDRKQSGIRRQLALHGRQLHKFSMTMAAGRQPRRKLSRIQTILKHGKRVYHKRGMKHLLLIMLLLLYQFFGAALFLYLEKSSEEDKEKEWRRNVTANRTILIEKIMPALFNNSDYLVYLSKTHSDKITQYLNVSFDEYEKWLGIKYSDQKIKWDFWNAMLYAGTVCTTIGYGHLYPNTYAGQWATMIYAIFGIPLVLSILDDMGKLLTMGLKYPWMVVKMVCRRVSQHCTNMSYAEIRRLDEEDRKALKIFDLPIPVALGVVIAWIFISSATFCLFEEWDYFKAFYFFFISLTTIGLGDIVPQQPKYLLFMFGYIIVGLSLVSMCVNLIQAKLEKSYNTGRDDIDVMSRRESIREEHHNKITLGVIQRLSSYSLSSKTGSPSKVNQLKKVSKMCQTLLSIPSPSRHPHANESLLYNSGRIIPSSISFDDVMKLVDTEEGDIIVLSELSREGVADGSLIKDNAQEDSEEDFGMHTYESVLLPQKISTISETGKPQDVQFRTKVSIIPNLETEPKLQYPEIPTARKVSIAKIESPVTSDKIIRCLSPNQQIFSPQQSLEERQQQPQIEYKPILCTEDHVPEKPKQSNPITRRLSKLFSPTGRKDSSPSTEGRRLSLLNMFQRKSTSKPAMLDPFELAEYKEIEIEQTSVDEGDRTPLDPNKEKRNKFFSTS